NPIDGAFNSGPCALNPTGKGCNRLLNGTQLFKQGDYSRNPAENSQEGVRYHAILPGGVESSLVYFHQRWAGDDGSNYAPLKPIIATGNAAQDSATLNKFARQGIFPAEAYAPYVNSF